MRTNPGAANLTRAQPQPGTPHTTRARHQIKGTPTPTNPGGRKEPKTTQTRLSRNNHALLSSQETTANRLQTHTGSSPDAAHHFRALPAPAGFALGFFFTLAPLRECSDHRRWSGRTGPSAAATASVSLGSLIQITVLCGVLRTSSGLTTVPGHARKPGGVGRLYPTFARLANRVRPGRICPGRTRIRGCVPVVVRASPAERT